MESPSSHLADMMHVEIQRARLWIVVGSLLRATPLCCWFQGSVSRAFTLLSCSVVRGARLCSPFIARLSRWSKCLWNLLGELRRDKNYSRPFSSSTNWDICWLRAGTHQQRRNGTLTTSWSGGRIRALCLSRNSESMCLEWSAHDG